MPDLETFCTNVAEQTARPGFDLIAARASRRRRRRAVGAVAAVVVAVGASVTVVDAVADRERSAAPPVSTPTPTPLPVPVPVPVQDEAERAALQALVDAPGTQLTAFSVGLDGSQLALYQQRGGDQVVAVQGLDDEPALLARLERPTYGLTPVPGGWVGNANARDAYSPVLIGVDGNLTALPLREGRGVQRGDVAVLGGGRFFRPGTGEMVTQPTADGYDVQRGVVTDTGVVVGPRRGGTGAAVVRVDERGEREVVISDDALVTLAELGGAGDTVAAALTRDPDPTRDGGVDLLTTIGVSTDGGQTWRLAAADGDEGFVESVTVTASGAVLVATSDHLVRLLPGTEQAEVLDAPGLDTVVHGDVVYRWDANGVDLSTDLGENWAPVAPPGRGRADPLDEAGAQRPSGTCDMTVVPESDEVFGYEYDAECDVAEPRYDTPMRATALAVPEELTTAERIDRAARLTLGDRFVSTSFIDGVAVIDVDVTGLGTTAGETMTMWDELSATGFQFTGVEVVEPRTEGSCERFGQWAQAGECLVVNRDGRSGPPRR